MKKLPLVRFGTYAIFLATALLAVRQRYVIPVHLPRVLGPDAVEWFGDTSQPDVHVSAKGSLDFSRTVLSGSDVLRLADGRMKESSISLPELEVAKIGLEVEGGRLRWRVTREVRRSLGDGTVWVTVFVDDKSGATKLERFQYPQTVKK